MEVFLDVAIDLMLRRGRQGVVVQDEDLSQLVHGAVTCEIRLPNSVRQTIV